MGEFIEIFSKKPKIIPETKIFVIVEEGSNQTKMYGMVLMRLLSLMSLSSKDLIDKLLLQFQNANY